MTYETPVPYPANFPCDIAGHVHLLNDCTNWVAVPDNLADAKALMALGGLSVSHDRVEK